MFGRSATGIAFLLLAMTGGCGDGGTGAS